ncbi:Hypothetical protein CINCED_3A014830 [Cinara cedri]|uniref:Uncharacterized protein n=1 Tax=Cinara cedri TaxID=506608 RepID=A0A5E4LZZ4_9HEMI|nr:Hypothetical protein CINCED_3A014830 [Cinara cedri]
MITLYSDYGAGVSEPFLLSTVFDSSDKPSIPLRLGKNGFRLAIRFSNVRARRSSASGSNSAAATTASGTTINGMRAIAEHQLQHNRSASAAAASAVGTTNTSTGTMTPAAGPQEQQPQAGAGTPVRMLQLDQSVIQAIADRCRTVRPDQTAVVEVAATVPASELPAEGYAIDGGRTVGHACAKCQLAFPDNVGLVAHQQRECRTTGSVALAHPAYGCRSCGVGANGETNTYGTVLALRAHIETVHRGTAAHYAAAASAMEDVVNQITALAAAKAVGRSPSPRDPNSDSNANLFCAPAADKKSAATSAAAAAAAKMHGKFNVPPANVTAAVPSGGQ